MPRCTLHWLVALAGAGTILPGPTLHAQGVTTVAVRVSVRMADGSDADGARVVIRSAATGFVLDAETRRGRFLVQGLEPGGPYSITVRRIGALARRWDDVHLTLGEPLTLDVVLEPAPLHLDSVVVTAGDRLALSCCHGGTATTLSDSLIHRLPSLDRNIYDFLRLVPQISARTGFGPGISGGGGSFRLNSFLTNGVSERSLSGSQPSEFAGGRSLPSEAVREYQVLLAPFDVRFGDFAGALVNTVTRSGTNRIEGSVFGYWRNDALARGGALAAAPYERRQLGAALSGPLLQNRLHLLVAGELERVESPMAGPFVGQPAGAVPPVPVSGTDLDRLETILAGYGLRSGSGEAVENRDRGTAVFARLDAALPRWNSRVVFWLNHTESQERSFSRRAAPDTFALSTFLYDQGFDSRTAALQLYTTLPWRGGGYNELSLSHRAGEFGAQPSVRQPAVRVALPAATEGMTTLVTGTPPEAQGGALESRNLILRDDLTLPIGGSHTASFGLEAQWFRLGRTGLPNAYGTWTFLGLDALEAGQADRFELARDLGSAGAPLPGGQYAAYAGDHWRVSRRLSLTLGLRADLLALGGETAPYNALVDSVYGRRTDGAPRRMLAVSPRIGFTWDPRGAGREQVRGGVGMFAGRPPLAWFHVPRQRFGEGVGTLRCGPLPDDHGPPPPFHPDPLDPPTLCAGGGGPTAPPPGDVELVDPDLGLARALRAALAYERRLPGGFVGTLEGLVTRNLSDFTFVNLNLAGPQATDPRGRVMYGTLDSVGRARPARVTGALPSAIELRNVSRNHALQLSASVTRQFADGLAATAAYTWSQARDVATPLRVNTRGLVNWGLRAVSGRHDDPSPGISLNDVPHRFVLAGTWRAPWPRWLTEVALMYVGESGSPFTWRAGGAGGLGDLNADGGLNDPIYIPLNASDPLIAFTSAEERDAFERFIERTPCLRRRRGRILERNGCREPWAHSTAASVRQAIPIGGRALEAQLDVLNLLNLVDGDWGRRRLANPVLLEHAGQAPPGVGASEPVFRFVDAAAEWTPDPAESTFQLQFGVRYRF